jgi:5'-nucleotidase (lipoprotein e(P4) family)
MEDNDAHPERSWIPWIVLVGLIALVALWLAVCTRCHGTQPAPVASVSKPGDICYGNVLPKDVPSTAPGDDPLTWKCEATLRRDNTDALHWFRDASEYRVLARSVYAQATLAADGFAKKYAASGFIVIMDADETLFDNSAYQKETEACGLKYWEPSWCDWNRVAEAGAIPGAVDFVKFVQGHGGYVAVVTNRKQAYAAWTVDNLHKLQIAPDEVELQTDVSDKTLRWQDVITKIQKNHTKPGQAAPQAVMWVGDQITDFPKLDASGQPVSALGQADGASLLPPQFGSQFFLLPQPLYGGWTGNPKR